MLLVRSQFANMLMYLFLGLFGFLGIPISMTSRRGAFLVVKGYCKTMFWIFRVVCGLHVEIRGEIPQGEVLVCSKHMSFLDVLMLSHALPRVKFVMKKELQWVPVIGIFAWRLGCPAVERGGRSAAITKMVEQLEADKEIGQTVIFPQGTRVLPGAKVRYKTGAGVVYERMEKPVCLLPPTLGFFGHGAARSANRGSQYWSFWNRFHRGWKWRNSWKNSKMLLKRIRTV